MFRKQLTLLDNFFFGNLDFAFNREKFYPKKTKHPFDVRLVNMYKAIGAIFVFCSFLFANGELSRTDFCDLVVFSKDRPMQLFAFLESLEKRVSNFRKVAILCKISPEYENGYAIVQRAFPHLSYVLQSNRSSNDFKPMLIELSFGDFGRGADYIVFAVDDIIVTSNIDIQEGIQKLKETNAFGLYYRLGNNIHYSLLQNVFHELPDLQNVDDSYLLWDMRTAKGDWAYPNTLDFTLYKKSDIQEGILEANFNGPNQMEGRWAAVTDKIGICPIHSRIVNVLLNTVSDFGVKGHRLTSAERLDSLFREGFKIDIEDFYNIDNISPHIYQPIRFIHR